MPCLYLTFLCFASPASILSLCLSLSPVRSTARTDNAVNTTSMRCVYTIRSINSSYVHYNDVRREISVGPDVRSLNVCVCVIGTAVLAIYIPHFCACPKQAKMHAVRTPSTYRNSITSPAFGPPPNYTAHGHAAASPNPSTRLHGRKIPWFL